MPIKESEISIKSFHSINADGSHLGDITNHEYFPTCGKHFGLSIPLPLPSLLLPNSTIITLKRTTGVINAQQIIKERNYASSF